MNVFVSTDQSLHQHIPTLFQSVIRNAGGADLNLMILATDLGQNERDYIQQRVPVDVRFIDMRPDVKMEQVRCHVKSVAMFNRIFAINQLAEEYDRGLYLDIDTIVDANLKPLYESEVGDCGLAGVQDLYMPKLHQHVNGHFTTGPRIEIKDHDLNGFNSGVLVMDFQKLKQNGAQEWMEERIQQNYMTDQPALNLYSNGRFHLLDRKWNVSVNHLRRYRSAVPKTFNILHWHGRLKPWLSNAAGSAQASSARSSRIAHSRQIRAQHQRNRMVRSGRVVGLDVYAKYRVE